MTQEEKTQIEERIVDVLKTVYDPEIPVNIYDLGMIYKIDVQEDYSVAYYLLGSDYVVIYYWLLTKGSVLASIRVL